MRSSNVLSAPHHPREKSPAPCAIRRVLWSFSVNACDVFVLCRALLTCDEVDVKRCAPTVKLGKTRMRVDITLPADQLNAALHQVMQHVDDVEIGRTQLLGLS